MHHKLSVLYSRAAAGLSAPLVSVETHVSYGMPGFTIVGLPEVAVKESKERVRSAIINSGFKFTNKKILINLAPADLPKDGGRFDLPIAIGILAATEQLPNVSLKNFEFAGELGLTGELRPISGIISFALATKKSDRNLIIPRENFSEANLIANNKVYPCQDLLEVCNHLLEIKLIDPSILTTVNHSDYNNAFSNQSNQIDLTDLEGQPQAKRALEIAAAGGHNILMVGPPGTGKTMLASRLPTIMSELSTEEALEVCAIYSLKGLDRESSWKNRPFRSPHHTISSAALVGGGSNPRPGEISLAHHGVLFLDELTEFNRYVLEVLREPIESGKIVISRAKQQIELPAKFQLVAAMNPCPCGHRGNLKVKCTCSVEQIKRYLAKLSAPFLDRIDICIEVAAVPPELLLNNATQNDLNKIYNSSNIKQKVAKAYNVQLSRQNTLNCFLQDNLLKNYCNLNATSHNLMQAAINKFQLSARSYFRILKLARTIADLDEIPEISSEHIEEAICLNKLSRLNYEI